MSGVQSYFEYLLLACTGQFDLVLVVSRLNLNFDALDVAKAFGMAQVIHLVTRLHYSGLLCMDVLSKSEGLSW